MRRLFVKAAKAAAVSILITKGFSVFGQTDQQIYTDSLQNNWQNWGWATLNYSNPSPVHSGADSIAVTIADNSYEAIYIAHTAFDSTAFSGVSFWIHGGPVGGQLLQIQALLGSTAQPATAVEPCECDLRRGAQLLRAESAGGHTVRSEQADHCRNGHGHAEPALRV